MDVGPESDKGDDLASRIEKAEAASRKKSDPFAALTEAQGAISATRIGADFVGAVLGGAVVGWGVDWIFDTKPWGLLVLLLAGFVTGFMNIVRAFDRSGSKS